jgi:hypothetical protein
MDFIIDYPAVIRFGRAVTDNKVILENVKTGKVTTLSVDPTETHQKITFEDIGNHECHFERFGKAEKFAFSVNLNPHASNLSRISEQQLRELFKENEIKFMQKRKEIKTYIQTTRIHEEFTPYVFMALLFLLLLELFIASR